MLCGAVLLVAAPPAAADDIYEIDDRLQSAGFQDAYTEAYDAYDQDGVRVTVDYTSDSESLAAYKKEAADLAEVVWEHIDGRVLVVDVAPLTSTSWSDGDLPPAVSFSRTQLEAAHGPRSERLDAADLETADDIPLTGILVFLGVWAGTIAAAVGITIAVMRSRRKRDQRWGGGPPVWGPPAPSWGPPSPQAWPAAPGTAATPAGPWQLPSG